MTTKKLVARVRQLRRRGLSFRAIEARFPVALGAGNGTRAYRLLSRASGRTAAAKFTHNLLVTGA